MFKTKHLRRQITPQHRRRAGLRLAFFFLFLLIVMLLILVASFKSSIFQNLNFGGSPILYLYETAHNIVQKGTSTIPLVGCNIFTGSWVYDLSYPMYNASSCPFAETGFRCQEHGRPDFDYLKWRWQPFGCNIPKFNAEYIRRQLNGQRVAFVGDSMGRTQWESFVCLLMADIPDKTSVYEVHRKVITKTEPYLAVYFSSFNFTIEYYRSPYLVREGAPPKHAPSRVQLALKLDKLESSEAKWQHADILIFNTGHWWTASKTFGRGCYFQLGNKLKLGMKIEYAYYLALNTWASWVKTKIDFNKTQVIFRSFEPAHWEGSWRNRACPVETKPIPNSTFAEEFPRLPILQHVVESADIPVIILNITTLSSYRRDSHVGNWTEEANDVDCVHWCLPGLPDTWNELLYASLLQNGRGVWSQ